METEAPTPRRELFVFSLGRTTHASLATHSVQAVKWDLPFEKPDLTELMAYSLLAKQSPLANPPRLQPLRRWVDGRIPLDHWESAVPTILRLVADYTKLDLAAAYARRATFNKAYGPYWVLLNVADCTKRHGSYYARFHNWICDIKRQVKPREASKILEKLEPYLIFNKETDDEIAGLSKAGSCPVREWNCGPFDRATGYR